jgi:hypothetical protein
MGQDSPNIQIKKFREITGIYCRYNYSGRILEKVTSCTPCKTLLFINSDSDVSLLDYNEKTCCSYDHLLYFVLKTISKVKLSLCFN